jgi:hypothetical protein
MMKKYFRTAEEAEAAAHKEYYRSAVTTSGIIGGPECPPEYKGDGRGYVQNIPENQKIR